MDAHWRGCFCPTILLMTITDRIIRRKLGVLELLVGAFPAEFVFGSSARAALLLALAILFYLAKKEFGGEFSLLDVANLFDKPKESK